MATHPDPAELAAYLDNALPPAADERVRGHLDGGCPACEREIDRLEQAAAAAGPAPLPPGLASRVRRAGRAPAPAGPPPAVPGFELVREVGRGGMAVVYEARDPAGRRVAVKLVPNAAFAHPELVARFEQECRLARDLSDRAAALPPGECPALTAVYAVGRTDQVLYISMEYAAGGTLRDRLPELLRHPREAARLVAEAAEAVGWLNRQVPPVFHRDCKPSNFLLHLSQGQATDGDPAAPLSTLTVRVSDFGLARRDGDPQLTSTGDLVGTVQYLAPELLRAGAAAGPATEVYALGATLYDLLDGGPPFRAGTMSDLLTAIRRGHPPRPGRAGPVPRDLQAVCLRALERDPARRYPSADALAADLRRFLAGRPVEAALPGLHRRPARWAAKNPAAAFVVGGLALAVLALGGLLSSARSRADAAGARADAAAQAGAEATARLALEAERRTRADERAARLEERYTLLLRLGVAEGDGREVLRLFDQARADGLALTPEMRLDYVRGLAGVYDTAAVRREVDAVLLDGLPPAVRGRYELWRATTRFGTDDAAAEGYLAAALTRPLPPAEREYAEGLRAATTPAAIERFRAAVRHDRLFQPARSDACLLLFTLGRLDEAIALADESARALPRHPDFPVILALAHGFKGDERRAAEAVGRLDGLLPAAEVRTLASLPPLMATASQLTRSLTGHGPPVADRLGAALAVQRLAVRLPLVGGDATSLGTVGRLFGCLPPVHRARLWPYLEMFNGVVRGGLMPSWPAAFLGSERLRAAAEAHPEGTLLLITATSFYDRTTHSRLPLDEQMRMLRIAAETAERAADTPGFAPLQEVAMDLAIPYYAILANPRVAGRLADPAAARHAAALLRRRLAAFGPVPAAHCLNMTRVAFIADDLTLARQVLDGWERQAPNELRAARQRAVLEYRAEAFGPAVRAADRVLARAPFDLGTHLVRLFAQVRLLLAAKRTLDWLPGTRDG